MEDHHVDRLGMQAWRHAQSTSTNCSIGLIRPGRRPTNTSALRTSAVHYTKKPAFFGKIKTSSLQCASRVSPKGTTSTVDAHRREAPHGPNGPRATARLLASRATHTQGPGWFAGPAVTAQGKHPIPSRTRPLSPAAPMVLRLKSWESRSPPDPSTNPILVSPRCKPFRGVEQPGSSSGS